MQFRFEPIQLFCIFGFALDTPARQIANAFAFCPRLFVSLSGLYTPANDETNDIDGCAGSLHASAAAQIMEERNPVPMAAGGGRVYRTEVVPYDARHDAEARNREAGGYWMAFKPEVAAAGDAISVVGQTVDIPYVWTDGDVYLHLENTRSAYTLWVNDQLVAEVEDSATPAEFCLYALHPAG